ncbi:MAG: CotH kinase family protein [Saprospiraceae bacterium]|nr:CotH kinase family protein [Candidatus Brachybacter algidus]MBK8746619.1 CotH kinase family protein [Candidatus Brachybacter algidus]
MKHFLYLLLCISFFRSNAQGLYDVAHITEIRISFVENNWDQIMDANYSNDLDERLIGTVSINGIIMDSCGVQFKGNSTYNPSNAKNPLNIKLDHVKKQNYQGWETLKLASGRNDPSALREVLSYELLRNYTEAPLSNFARVYINDKFYGVFSSSESIDGDFQERYLYANDDNTRVKCNPLSVFGDGSSLKYYSEDSSDYFSYYEMKSDYGWNDLAGFCNHLSKDGGEIDKYLDVDRALWMLAFNNVVVNLDSYTGPFRQNYYMIKDDLGRMKPVIWDLNMSFGAFSMISTGGQGGNSLTKMQNMTPYLRENDSNWPLVNTLFTNPTYKRMYIAHCKTMLEEQITSGLYAQRGQVMQDLIAPDVKLDINSTYSYTKFLNNLNTSISGSGGGGQSFCGITELMEVRKAYLETNTAFTALPPAITDLLFPSKVVTNTAFSIIANISDATNSFVAYRHDGSELFTKIQLLDDGLNDDGMAGDGIFGKVFSNGISRPIQFYIYSENDNAGIFSPVRAEHEFHSITLSAGGLVINEIMASNTKTIQDQDGEYDDWIELYNNSDATINLENYKLSDKLDALDKWTFPSATIAPNSYLIIWADEDQEQAGLHCNFKLSASGESVALSDANGTVLDQVTFPILGEEKTYGRYPNGTGSFAELDPTYNAENSVSLATKTSNDFRVNVYPNPFNDKITVDSEHKINSLRIIDVNGRVMLSSNDGSKTISTSNLSPGVYILEINYQKVVKVVKI